LAGHDADILASEPGDFQLADRVFQVIGVVKNRNDRTEYCGSLSSDISHPNLYYW